MKLTDSVVIFARDCKDTQVEFETARNWFQVETSLVKLPPNKLVIGRYSVLPFYKWIEDEIKLQGSVLINSFAQHRYIANFDYYHDVSDLTFKTWFSGSEIPEGKFVVKGATNSRKFEWNSMMFAESRADAIRIGCDLKNDSMIKDQQILYREYVPLETLEVGVNGLPFTNEWRVFVYGGEIVACGFWSS